MFESVLSAEYEAYGKPHPGVYISAAKQMKYDPQYCCAIEDSLNGVIAAKAAKMKCIAVPAQDEPKIAKFAVADVVLNSLEELNHDTIDAVFQL